MVELDEVKVRRLVWVTNIPTPYRNLRYRRFGAELPRNRIHFDVVYMAPTESGRFWRFTSKDLDHPHRIFAGLHLKISGMTAHFNPGLIAHVLRRRRDVWVLGGYDNPTTVALFLIAGLRRRVSFRGRPLVLLGSESNVTESTARAGLRHRVKRLCVELADGYVVPGRAAHEALSAAHPVAKDRPVFTLPNIVDEDVFVHRVEAMKRRRSTIRAELGVSANDQLWIVPARLEPYKGIHIFLECVREIQGIRIVIAGAGSEESRLKSMARHMPVTFLGQVSEDRMVELYAAADLFVLPSLRDASPLTAVEALAAGLPIVLSERAGNHPDVLSNDNGWLFKPQEQKAMRALLMRIAALPADSLREMGNRSSEVFQERFDSARCVATFAEQLRTWIDADGATVGRKRVRG